jgi:hypothetical protein
MADPVVRLTANLTPDVALKRQTLADAMGAWTALFRMRTTSDRRSEVLPCVEVADSSAWATRRGAGGRPARHTSGGKVPQGGRKRDSELEPGLRLA